MNNYVRFNYIMPGRRQIPSFQIASGTANERDNSYNIPTGSIFFNTDTSNIELSGNVVASDISGVDKITFTDGAFMTTAGGGGGSESVYARLTYTHPSPFTPAEGFFTIASNKSIFILSSNDVGNNTLTLQSDGGANAPILSTHTDSGITYAGITVKQDGMYRISGEGGIAQTSAGQFRTLIYVYDNVLSLIHI